MNPRLDHAFDHAQALVTRMQDLADRKIDAAPDALPELVDQHVASTRELEPTFTALSRVLKEAGLSDRLSTLAASSDAEVSARASRLLACLNAAHFSHSVSASVLKRKVNLARAMALAVQGIDATAALPGASNRFSQAERSRTLGQA
jgi:hypothetical protein